MLIIAERKHFSGHLNFVMLMFVEFYCLYLITSSLIADFENIKQKDVSFIVETGTFTYRRRKTGSSVFISYFLDSNELYTHHPTFRTFLYNKEKVEVYFYMNCENQKEAFLINKIDKNNIENI